jgi:hypothetical protein
MVNSIEWEKSVLEQHSVCANCGDSKNLIVRPLVAPLNGGQSRASNASVLCRGCEINSFLSNTETQEKQLVNFWLSASLYEWLKTNAEKSSMGSLIRYMISRYTGSPSAFEDLALWVDVQSEVKVNIWVPQKEYLEFKTLIEERGSTVTDALKSLLLIFKNEQTEAHHD